MSEYKHLRYSLLYDVDNPKSKRDAEITKELIDSIIKLFARRLRRIKKVFPDVGIGDTETDEEISYEVFCMIHYGKFNDRELLERELKRTMKT